MDRYDHESIESKWQQEWERRGTFRVDEDATVPDDRRQYVLDMFPYPSAEGLHVGHPEGYTGSDIVARYRRMKGDRVLHPMGFDAFGLPAENFALKTGVHPAKSTAKNIENMRRQIKRLGFSYDWSREVITSDPKYYKWTQWIFLKLFEHGLAYEAMSAINWCPKDKTGLANEEVIDGCCERCGTPVVKKEIRQWLVRITDERYVERLLNDLTPLDWPQNIKQLQRNWIGKSEGAELTFPLEGKYNFVLLHGFNGDASGVFFPWLKNDLLKRGHDVFSPDLPNPAAPTESEQVSFVLKHASFDEHTVILGHSLGAVVAMKVVEKLKEPIAGLVLAGGFTQPKFRDKPRPFQNTFSWTFDYERIKKNAGFVKTLSAVNDFAVPREQGQFLKEKLGGELIEAVTEGEHFTAEQEPVVLQHIVPGIRTFTTRPDTVFGATYLVVAPEHPLVRALPIKNRKAVEKYVEAAKRKSDRERSALEKWSPAAPANSSGAAGRNPAPSGEAGLVRGKKTGVELKGAHAINPSTGKPIPIWVADYVLMGYGTGAIMAVPAHDERDQQFAKRYHLPIVPVIKPPRLTPHPPPPSAGAWGRLDADLESSCWTGDGTMVNSGTFDGMDSQDAREKIVQWLLAKGLGKPSIQYKLRDWVFSRQRYWGEPIPIIHCEKEGIVPLREEDLPLLLPEVKKYEPTGTGEGPLANVKEWVNTTCWRCGSKAKRETNTMPQWAGSNWYFLRYCDPNNDKQLADPKKLAYWMPINLYVGGAEHAVLHLLYARFIYKFLYDIEAVPKACGDEPFVKLINQGVILGEDGQKMSKSRGNVLNPDDIVNEYGADTMRMYEMFMGPFSDAKPWSTRGIIGVRRFLDRVWQQFSRSTESEQVSARTHRLIQKVTADIESFKFNTSVAAFMEYMNDVSPSPDTFGRADREAFLKLLAPFAPHLAEELWSKLGHKICIAGESWPTYDEAALVESTVTVVVQVNGKVRDQLNVAADASEADVREKALASSKVRKWLAGKEPKKIVYVKGRVLSIVV